MSLTQGETPNSSFPCCLKNLFLILYLEHSLASTSNLPFPVEINSQVIIPTEHLFFSGHIEPSSVLYWKNKALSTLTSPKGGFLSPIVHSYNHFTSYCYCFIYHMVALFSDRFFTSSGLKMRLPLEYLDLQEGFSFSLILDEYRFVLNPTWQSFSSIFIVLFFKGLDKEMFENI